MKRTYDVETRMMKGFDLWLSGAVEHVAPGRFRVRSQSGAGAYGVTRDTCGCPDHAYFRSLPGYHPCKHQAAAAFQLAEEQERR